MPDLSDSFNADIFSDDDPDRPAPRFVGEATPLYPRYLGVEIECGHDYDGPSAPRSFWTKLRRLGETDEDGSISFEQSIEFKPFPARGAAFVDGITKVCALFAEYKYEVNRSCGLHVHVDARDFTSSDVLKLVRLNAKIESALYGVVARSRRKNTFALPLREDLLQPYDDGNGTVDPKDPDSGTEEKRAKCIDVSLYGSERAAMSFKRDPYKIGQRYRGLNLTSLPLLGTIEFRHHQGTLNPRKILMWAALCTAVVEYAKIHTEREVHALRGTPAEVLDKILRREHLSEVRTWVRIRRAFFAESEHGRKLPRGRMRPVEPPIDVSAEHAEREPGEVGTVGRVGQRAYGRDD